MEGRESSAFFQSGWEVEVEVEVGCWECWPMSPRGSPWRPWISIGFSGGGGGDECWVFWIEEMGMSDWGFGEVEFRGNWDVELKCLAEMVPIPDKANEKIGQGGL